MTYLFAVFVVKLIDPLVILLSLIGGLAAKRPYIRGGLALLIGGLGSFIAGFSWTSLLGGAGAAYAWMMIATLIGNWHQRRQSTAKAPRGM